MAPDHEIHADLAGYLLDRLGPAERARFEDHLVGCPACRAEVAALRPAARSLADVAPSVEPPPDLRAGVLGAVEAAAAAQESVRRGPAATARRRFRLPSLPRPAVAGLAGAAAVAIAIFVGVRIGEGEGSDGSADPLLAGKVELAGEMVGARERDEGRLVVRRQETGREVLFRSRSLPVLPKGEYYELWFVGPGDSAARPNRIPAGTFHPDEDGRTAVVLHAAVDPARFPRVEITAESGAAEEVDFGPTVASLSRRSNG